jgi:hypothetical protein
VPYGTAARLVGAIRAVDAVTLEERVAGGPWQPGPALAMSSDGGFSADVRPLVTTDYRLAATDVATPPIRVRIVPLVTLQVAPGGLAGAIEPARAGVTVELEAADGSSLPTTATTDDAGAFAFPPPPPGSYRATALGGSSQPVLVG